MATVKIPYTYKEYKFSKIGTLVDKFCHSPYRIGLMLLLSTLLCFYYVMCFSVIPLPEGLHKGLSNLAAILFGISFVGSFFLGMICDKCRLSERIALWDLTGRNITGKMKIAIAVLAVVLILPGVTAAGVTLVSRTQDNAYHKTMASLSESDNIAVEGNQAVAYVEERFSTLYIPEEYQAKTPENVRFILRCTDGEELYGHYGITGIAGYLRWRKVEVVDRKDDQVISSETFFGGNPPLHVSDNDAKKQYGSFPSDEEIAAWVAATLSKLAT